MLSQSVPAVRHRSPSAASNWRGCRSWRDETPGQIDPHAAPVSAAAVLVFVLEAPLHQQKGPMAQCHGGLVDAAAPSHAERPRPPLATNLGRQVFPEPRVVVGMPRGVFSAVRVEVDEHGVEGRTYCLFRRLAGSGAASA